MRLWTRTALVLASLSLLGACGRSNGPQPAASAPAQLDAATRAKLSAEYQALPKGVLIRVPTEGGTEKGADLLGQADMRAFDGNTVTTASAAAAAWDSAKAVKVKAKNELDGDTSTQSWSNWLPGQPMSPGIDINTYGNNNNYDINVVNGYNNGLNDGYGNGINTGYGNGINTGYNNGPYYYNQSYGPYYNWYRPRAYSLVYTGAFWNYNHAPSCYYYGGYRYYFYPRPGCNLCNNVAPWY